MELYKENEIKTLSFEQILEKEGAGEETDTYETIGQILYDPDVQTTHLNNILLGNDTGKIITTGENNTFVGFQAGFSDTTGSGNFFAGYQAGYSLTTGQDNVFIGYQAGYSDTISIDNVFIGYQAGYSDTRTRYNTFIGYQAGYSNKGGASFSGWDNVFIGFKAGYNSNGLSGTQSFSNAYIGTKSGYSTTTGSLNSFFGVSSGYSNQTGTSNVFLGYSSGYYETGANKLFIDNVARASEADGRLKALMYGVFDATVASQSLAVNAILKVNSTAGLYGIFDMSSIATSDKTFTFPNASGTVALTSNLGTIASQNSNNVSITGGSISGITDIAVADGGTGASTATGACSNLGLGTEDNVQFNGVLLQRGDDTNHTLNDLYHIGDTYSNFFSGYRARASTSVVASGDVLLFIAGKGYDGAAYKTAAYITFEVDGTPGINDMPGRIVFYTTPDGDQYGVERMRIKSGGNVSFSGAIEVDNVQVVGNRVVDARCDDTINSGDATTDGVIDALRDAMIAHGLIAAA